MALYSLMFFVRPHFEQTLLLNFVSQLILPDPKYHVRDWSSGFRGLESIISPSFTWKKPHITPCHIFYLLLHGKGTQKFSILVSM